VSNCSIQPARITKVLPDSIGEAIGFEPGDRLVAINGQRPRDLIDYQFLCCDESLQLEVLDAQGNRHTVELEKEADDDLGLEFETALFDGLIQCNNQCPFCFIDQQPPGKRGSLYLKDDDYRLSFLYGSYLTLTNLPQREWDRIAQLRLSPLYVSVHATEPEIRSKLLKNQRAGQILEQLRWFQRHRLQIHAQVVVCPGINDGLHLERTLLDLAQFRRSSAVGASLSEASEASVFELDDDELPTVLSVAVVPVGLTRFRSELDELTPVIPDQARDVIAQVQSLQEKFRVTLGTTFVWLADEWFLIAGAPLPSAECYEDYPQIGNGVGSIRLFLDQFFRAAEYLPDRVMPARHLTWIVGNAVEQAFQPISDRLNQIQGLKLDLVALRSAYWGQEITVTGLLTGSDLLAGLQGRDLGDGVLLPALMLKQDAPCFLDDMTVAELARKLETNLWPVDGVDGLIQACLRSHLSMP